MNQINSFIKVMSQMVSSYQTTIKNSNPIQINYPNDHIKSTNKYYLQRVKGFLFKRI